jgi:hypothetical protein
MKDISSLSHTRPSRHSILPRPRFLYPWPRCTAGRDRPKCNPRQTRTGGSMRLLGLTNRCRIPRRRHVDQGEATVECSMNQGSAFDFSLSSSLL